MQRITELLESSVYLNKCYESIYPDILNNYLIDQHFVFLKQLVLYI